MNKQQRERPRPRAPPLRPLRSRECLRDEARAAVLAEHRVRLAGVGHPVREQQRVLRGEHVVHEGPHGGLVGLHLAGGGAEHSREAEVLRLRPPRERKAQTVPRRAEKAGGHRGDG